MRAIDFSEARSNLGEVLDAVARDHEPTLIRRSDGEPAVVLSLNDYNALQETMYLLGTPANAAHVIESIAQLRGAK